MFTYIYIYPRRDSQELYKLNAGNKAPGPAEPSGKGSNGSFATRSTSRILASYATRPGEQRGRRTRANKQTNKQPTRRGQAHNRAFLLGQVLGGSGDRLRADQLPHADSRRRRAAGTSWPSILRATRRRCHTQHSSRATWDRRTNDMSDSRHARCCTRHNMLQTP